MNDQRASIVTDLGRRRNRSRIFFLILTTTWSLLTIYLAVVKQPAYDIMGVAGVAIVSLNLLVQNEFGDTPVDMTLVLLPAVVGFIAYLVRTLCTIEAHDLGQTVQTIFAIVSVIIEAVLDAGFLLLAAGRLAFEKKV